MKGGVHQSHCPVWIFVVTLRQVSRSRRIGGLPYQNSTMCRRRCSGGVGTEPLRSILGLCFRELTVEDLKMWERHMERTHKWPQSLKALRLDKCKEEAERQVVDIPPWYLLDGVTGLQVTRPYRLCGVCSGPILCHWNLLDTQGEEGTPLLSIADWLKFVVGRSTIDQGRSTPIMTKVFLRARWTTDGPGFTPGGRASYMTWRG